MTDSITKSTTGKRPCRRRTRPVLDEERVSRPVLLANRDRLLTARYYYYTELKKIRHDDALYILSEEEFFIDERTVQIALLKCDEYYRELLGGKPGTKELNQAFPGINWRH